MSAIAALVWVGNWAAEQTVAEIRTRATNAAELNASVVRNNLERYRALPFVLSQNVDILQVLSFSKESDILRLDANLEALAGGLDASAIYLLDASGLAVAASNWQEPATFVGVDYRFRPYFQEAVSRGESEHFALGTVSHEAGLYVSRRIMDSANKLLGVIVVKVDFKKLEADWRHRYTPVFVTDANGVILLSSDPAWRFRTLAPLSLQTMQTLRTSLQFGDAPFTPLPLPAASDMGSDLVSATSAALPYDVYLHTQVSVNAVPGWTLHTLTPSAAAINQARMMAQLVLGLAMILAVTTVLVTVKRRQRQSRREHERRDLMIDLSAQVDARTHQLEASNKRLEAAMQDQLATQARVEILQDELAQANKLTLLGQVTAGVAHEINQPVAAIRTYAENAVLFIDQNRSDQARENLGVITTLTDRIGRITGELRRFARRGHQYGQHASVDDAIEGALLLVGAQQKRQRVALHRFPDSAPISVHIDTIRLEQILVNLLQNALDALHDRTDGRIDLQVIERTESSTVEIVVADNGAGMTAAQRARLFVPFSSTKSEGLGLGLVISRDLAREAGGDLSVIDEPAFADCTGARFRLILRKA